MKKTLLAITVLTLALGTFSVAAAGDCDKATKTAGEVCGTSAAVQASAAKAPGACCPVTAASAAHTATLEQTHCPVTAAAAYEQAEKVAEAELANLEKSSKSDAS